MPLKIRYFQETDTLYIEFRAARVVETKDLDENTISSAKGDTGLTIACVRCALKTGSWGLLSRPRAMLDGFRW